MSVSVRTIFFSSRRKLWSYTLQTTIIFQYIIHIKIATLRPCIKFQNLPSLQTSYIGTLLISFHYRKYEHSFFTKVLRTRAISERDIIECHLSDNRQIKKHVSFYLPLVMLFHMREELIIFPLNYICLSTEWDMISFCPCICFALTANQTPVLNPWLCSIYIHPALETNYFLFVGV